MCIRYVLRVRLGSSTIVSLWGYKVSNTKISSLSPSSSSYWISTNFFLLASLGWLSLTSCPVSWKEPPLLVPVCTYRLLSLSLVLLLKNSFVLETPPCPLALLLVGWGDKEKRFRRPSNRNNLPLTLMVKICLFFLDGHSAWLLSSTGNE